MKNYSVSIIIPVYNSRNCLPKCLDSLVYESSYKNDVEVIIVDDHSDYDYQDIINQYTNKLNIYCVSTEYHTNNPGMARQTGIKYANNNYLCFIDSDDEVEIEAFYNVIKYLDINNIDIPLLVTPMLYVDEQDENNNYIMHNNLVWVLGKFIKKSFIIDNNICFKSTFFTHEDLNFLTQIENILTLNNIDVCWLNDNIFLFYYYKKNDSSITCQSRYLNNISVTYEIYSTIDFLNAYVMETHIFLEENQHKMNQIAINTCIIHMIESIIYSYFSYQHNWFIFGYYGRPYSDLKKYIDMIETHLDITIIDYLFNEPWIYYNAFSISKNTIGFFLEKESLIDFLNHIKNNK